jgi:uncharacterized protein (TIGR03086 family)
MNEAEVFVLADRTLESVIAQVSDDQWDAPVPGNFPRSDTERTPTLREIVNYQAYDDAWIPDMLAGTTIDDAGREQFDGDLLGDDPLASFRAIVDKACAAAEGLDDFERTVHLSYGDYTAREYLWQANSFRGLRAVDIARVIGADTTLPDELVQGLWDEISPNAEEWRSIGVFSAAVEVPENASLQERLLGLTGREPR